MRRLVSLATVCVMLFGPVSAADTKLTPDDIFAKTRAVLAHNDLPHFVLYTISISFIRDDHRKWQRYDGYEDTNKVRTVISDISREEFQHPYEPPGGVAFGMPFVKMPRAKSSLLANPLGAPNLSIDYAFNMQPGSSRKSRTSEPEASTIPIIGRAEAIARDYRITLAGTETEDGVLVDHLNFEPTHDPNRLRLRDMWLDAATYAPLRLLVSANFDRPPLNTVPWMVWFRKVDGGIIIDHEEAQAPLDYGFDGHIAHATVAFTEVTFKDKLGPYDLLGRNASSESRYDLWEP